VEGPLAGVSVLVAGAGLAGLAAARDLAALGADLTVVDARDRLGGRVWTIYDGFAEGQHAEAGGDLIYESQDEIRNLCRELGLKLTRILRGGFGFAGSDAAGRPRLLSRNASTGWDRLSQALASEIRPYRLAERRWDSPIAHDLARRAASDWLDAVRAEEDLRATVRGLRGFFLADPEELSLLALVDQFADEHGPLPRQTFRIEGGNHRLAAALAAPLGDRVRLNTELVAVSQRGQGVRATLRHRRTVAPLSVDYLVLALPATTLRRVPITPALPAQQHDAIARLNYGRATKTLLQFSRRFWVRRGRPAAFGSALPFGAVWDGNEEQRRRPGILSLLAGGGASDPAQAVMTHEGPQGFVEMLAWLGAKQATLVAARQIVWEHEPFARGGYAYFDPRFDPALRAWLALPCGRLFFAGEHTSLAWQGYMNGALESGRRAAAEVVAVHRRSH
jgi:monoamine oxidase